MLDFLTTVMTVDQWTLFIIGLMSAWAGYILKEALSSGFLATIFFPVFLFGGLLGRYVFIEMGLFISQNKDANLILATGAGLIVSLVVVTILARMYMYITAIRTRANVSRL